MSDTEEMKETRNYGIDALRICSMLMVIVLHVLGRGGVLNTVDKLSAGGLSWRSAAAWFMETAAYCAVNCYALISGYVGVNAKYRYANFAVLWLRVAFYSIGITALFAVFMPGSVGKEQWLNAFFPVFRSHYWYFSAYTGLFFLIPLLNAGVRHMTKRQVSALLIGASMVFSVVPTLSGKDVFKLSGGYSVWWLMVLYILGGYIRKYGLLKRLQVKWCFAGYFLAVVLAWGLKMAQRVGLYIPGEKVNWVVYTSPAIVAAGIFLLLGFERMKLPKRVKGAVRALSPLAFSVYLIHVQNLVWDHWMANRFVFYGHLFTLKQVIAVPCTVVAIYAVCSLVDAFREMLFLKLRVRQRLMALEDRVFGDRLS